MHCQPSGYSQNVTPSICVLALILWSVPCRPTASASPTCAETRVPTGQLLPSHHRYCSWGIPQRAAAVHRFLLRRSLQYRRAKCFLFSRQRIAPITQVSLHRLLQQFWHAHTYVKSWRTTLAGQKGTSTLFCFVFQSKMFIASVSFTKKPSQLRILDSNNTRIE